MVVMSRTKTLFGRYPYFPTEQNMIHDFITEVDKGALALDTAGAPAMQKATAPERFKQAFHHFGRAKEILVKMGV